MRGNVWLVMIPFFLSGCISRHSEVSKNVYTEFFVSDTNHYASGFSIQHARNLKIITVTDPWQHAEQIAYTYYLSDTFPSSGIIDEFNCEIKTPVTRVACLSTTHIGFIEFIDETSTVIGISGKEYVCSYRVSQQIKSGYTVDVGYDENLNYEMLLDMNPDVVFAYGVSSSITKTIQKLNELNIPVVMIGEYLEQEPLAKMEWVKVFAAFYNKDESTFVKFDSVAEKYNQLADMATDPDNKPSVLLGLPFRGQWFVSGSASYIARLINDAGGDYVWNDLLFNESRPMNLEVIFERAITADYWLNPGDANSLDDVAAVDSRFQQLKSFRNRTLYNNNLLTSASGGNAFFESGVVEPDIILSDLISILHPQLLPSHNLRYYRKLH